eukprot:TRINITY_DN16446_c0_g1_i2.p2 TRINITY_DN16446_c0_g1~~TRINITY_DN16446_c0_g1_i2.p2  ORF type:complete len:122 (-),score=23.66 TRINITY_DN16446_c0_g1_i2:105-470(-)
MCIRDRYQRRVHGIDIDREYINQILRVINPEAFSNRPLKVVVDPMYGSGVGYLDRILTELGCEVRTINNYRDPLFGGSIPEPTDENKWQKKKKKKKKNIRVCPRLIKKKKNNKKKKMQKQQ